MSVENENASPRSGSMFLVNRVKEIFPRSRIAARLPYSPGFSEQHHANCVMSEETQGKEIWRSIKFQRGWAKRYSAFLNAGFIKYARSRYFCPCTWSPPK